MNIVYFANYRLLCKITKSFINGEGGMPAIDRNSGSVAEQNGHGTATMAILVSICKVTIPKINYF